jgi:hypothetical protein
MKRVRRDGYSFWVDAEGLLHRLDAPADLSPGGTHFWWDGGSLRRLLTPNGREHAGGGRAALLHALETRSVGAWGVAGSTGRRS